MLAWQGLFSSEAGCVFILTNFNEGSAFFLSLFPLSPRRTETRQTQTLYLPTAQASPPFTNDRVIALRERLDKVVNICCLRRLYDRLKACIGASQANIFRNGRVEHIGLLWLPCDQLAPFFCCKALDRLIINANLPLRRLYKTQEQVINGRFARTTGADDRYLLPWLHLERDSFQSFLARMLVIGFWIAVMNIFKRKRALNVHLRSCCCRFGGFLRRCFENVEDAFSAGCTLHACVGLCS